MKRKDLSRKVFIVAACLILANGCSTTYTKAEFPDSPSQVGCPYSGIRFNLASWNSRVFPPLDESSSFLFIPVATVELLLDLPFSFIADTLYLPVDLSTDIEKEDTINRRGLRSGGRRPVKPN